ncbi:hypothetical protein [Pararhodonellum marinum]|uniref:hypothetical protein n=1 Tax=Pararhodonellum marinum TaxID=2755358 RepID=UPI00188F6C9C|nr:hypothetical protein [Pararhodonellum marinum]
MKQLSENWITDGWMDFEYKKYLLLAYLQEVEKQFKEVKLYPPLAELITHYQNLANIQEQKNSLKTAFPKEVNKADFQKLKLEYQNLHVDGESMKTLDEIINFAMPKIKSQIEEGKSIYDFLEENLEIETIGLSPLYQKEGYAFLTLERSTDIYIYRYKINFFQNSMDKFRGIAMQFVSKVTKSLVDTFENIKLDLAKLYKDLPNPATFRIHSPSVIPLEESFLPISKRVLLQHVN